MRISGIKRIIGSIFKLVSFVVFIISTITNNDRFLFVSVLFLWAGLFLNYFYRKTITIAAFLLTFFTFLLGTLLAKFFDSTIVMRVTNQFTFIHMYECLYFSLITLDIGVLMANRVNVSCLFSDKPNNVIPMDIKANERIQKASRIVFLITAIFSLTISLEKALFVIIGGNYNEYYVNFVSKLPSFFIKMSEINKFTFYIYLSTLPNPQKSKLPLSMYLLTGFVGLLYGQRGQIIMAFLFVIIYIVLYENYCNKAYEILTKKCIILLIVCVPFILVFLEYYKYVRNSMVYEFAGVWVAIKNLITSLGQSVNIIGQGYELQELFPTGHFYSLGGVIDFITKNVLLRPILGTTAYHDNTIEMALYGNSYGQTITYLGWGANMYLSGRGMGSCYIAEAFHDLSYWGVGIFSFVYGVVLTKVNSLDEGRWIRNTIVLMSMYHILYAPRDSAGNFISAFFNYSFILSVVLVILVSKTRLVKREGN